MEQQFLLFKDIRGGFGAFFSSNMQFYANKHIF
jgi:hypothetical protein